MRGELMKSLFGEEISENPPRETHGKFVDWKRDHYYRKSDHLSRDRCAYCKYFRKINYHSKVYFKCGLMGMSRSEASDIRAGYICKSFDGSQ